MNSETLSGIITFLQKAENLKSTIRSAHTANGREESSAEHSWRLCLMVLVFAKEFPGADIARLLQMAILHDLGEAVCGNTPAIDQGEATRKSNLERKGMEELTASLPEALRNEFLAVWDEYEQARTPEAKLIKGLDKLETIMQHTQGKSPPGFCYEFNLRYGQEYMDGHPLFKQLRDVLDKKTQELARVEQDATTDPASCEPENPPRA